MRLNAYLSQAGIASRRKSDELIKAGRVTVNGKAGQLNTEVSRGDAVRLDGKPVEPQAYRYILINKPKQTLTTLKDPHGRRKVVDLINIRQRVAPVGRLDWDTTGALLLTNDGALANKLMHPSFAVDKVYEAEIRGEISERKLNKIKNGLQLEDGVTAPAAAEKISPNSIRLAIHEGRNRQVKRMLAAVGLEVVALHRSEYGGLKLTGLKPGKWRDLTKQEIKLLKMVK